MHDTSRHPISLQGTLMFISEAYHVLNQFCSTIGDSADNTKQINFPRMEEAYLNLTLLQDKSYAERFRYFVDSIQWMQSGWFPSEDAPEESVDKVVDRAAASHKAASELRQVFSQEYRRLESEWKEQQEMK